MSFLTKSRLVHFASLLLNHVIISIKPPHFYLLKKFNLLHTHTHTHTKHSNMNYRLTSGRYYKDYVNFHFCKFFIGVLTLPTLWRFRRFALPSYTPKTQHDLFKILPVSIEIFKKWYIMHNDKLPHVVWIN